MLLYKREVRTKSYNAVFSPIWVTIRRLPLHSPQLKSSFLKSCTTAPIFTESRDGGIPSKLATLAGSSSHSASNIHNQKLAAAPGSDTTKSNHNYKKKPIGAFRPMGFFQKHRFYVCLSKFDPSLSGNVKT